LKSPPAENARPRPRQQHGPRLLLAPEAGEEPCQVAVQRLVHGVQLARGMRDRRAQHLAAALELERGEVLRPHQS
jgi:hypothetical protein